MSDNIKTVPNTGTRADLNITAGPAAFKVDDGRRD